MEEVMYESVEGSWNELSEFVIKLMDDHDIPGIAVGLFYQGQNYSAGFGVTNVDHPLSVTPDTLFQIGSISKTFTGTAIMRLVEMGKVELDAPIRTYVPDFRVVDETATYKATVRQLLTHTGGWDGDLYLDTGPGNDALERYVAKMAGQEQLTQPGTLFSYNIAGFSLAGRLMELMTGEYYEEALAKLILAPLGLQRTFVHPSDVMTHRFVCGHLTGDDGPQVARPWPLRRSANPEGGIASTVLDLLQYARFHLGDGKTADGTRLLSAELMRQMQSPQLTVRRDSHRGLSWRILDVEGVREIGHPGETLGQVSLLVLVPEHRFALVILTNSESGWPAINNINKWVYRRYFGLEMRDPEPIETSVDELAPYVGFYYHPFADTVLDFQEGKLVGELTYKKGFPTTESPVEPSPPPFTLQLCGSDRLIIPDGPLKGMLIDMIRREDGTIGWLRIFDRICVRKD
jgi:CubicO group peptidase (beta-lactamase class C family)